MPSNVHRRGGGKGPHSLQDLDPSLPSRLWEPHRGLGSHRSNQVCILQNISPPDNGKEGGLEEDADLMPTDAASALYIYVEQRGGPQIVSREQSGAVNAPEVSATIGEALGWCELASKCKLPRDGGERKPESVVQTQGSGWQREKGVKNAESQK